jgi:hypothetical protein
MHFSFNIQAFLRSSNLGPRPTSSFFRDREKFLRYEGDEIEMGIDRFDPFQGDVVNRGMFSLVSIGNITDLYFDHKLKTIRNFLWNEFKQVSVLVNLGHVEWLMESQNGIIQHPLPSFFFCGGKGGEPVVVRVDRIFGKWTVMYFPLGWTIPGPPIVSEARPTYWIAAKAP